MLPDARWLLVHLLLLGGVGNAIITWSWHFTGALVRSPASPGQMRSQVLRQVGHNLGAVAVVAGVVGHRPATAVAGALVVGSVLAWHGLALAARTRGSLGGRFRRTVDHYVAACLLLPVGATLGALLAAGRSAEWHGRLVLAHLTLNLLGFVGLTVLGTLVTLWPTMLRTRLEDGSERTAARLLPVLLGAVLVTVGAALLGLRWVAVLGLLTYAAAALTHAVPFARTALRRAPADFATWSVAAGSTWLLLGLGLLVGLLAATPRLAHVPTRLDEVVTALAVGWVAQVLLGALAYLLPVMLGGGPAAVRRITAITQAQEPCGSPSPTSPCWYACCPSPPGCGWPARRSSSGRSPPPPRSTSAPCSWPGSCAGRPPPPPRARHPLSAPGFPARRPAARWWRWPSRVVSPSTPPRSGAATQAPASPPPVARSPSTSPPAA